VFHDIARGPRSALIGARTTPSDNRRQWPVGRRASARLLYCLRIIRIKNPMNFLRLQTNWPGPKSHRRGKKAHNDRFQAGLQHF